MSPSLPSPAPPLPSSQLTDPTSAVCTGPITPTGGEDTPEERDDGATAHSAPFDCINNVDVATLVAGVVEQSP
ncbi:hypothetical protein DFH09DRAFT_1329298 [Mycena vulgaris]|nr:hypothetical protein DFH09DRAFT_1329298 [Mycena vulgaris]